MGELNDPARLPEWTTLTGCHHISGFAIIFDIGITTVFETLPI